MDRNKINGVLAERIGTLRAEAGESQQQLADALEVKRETVKFWESGERQIKAADLVNLALHFGVSADYLLGLAEEKTRNTELRGVCEFTGLTEDSVTVIKHLSPFHLGPLNKIIVAENFKIFLSIFHIAHDFSDALKVEIKNSEGLTGFSGNGFERFSKLRGSHMLAKYHAFECSEAAIALLDEVSGYKQTEEEAAKILNRLTEN